MKLCVKSVCIHMARRFLAKSRGYMLTCAFKKKREEDNICENKWNYEMNEKIHKIY